MIVTQKWQADLCVIGGGLAGMCAALAAARRGASVVLMHDRPIPGGNASSEIRMWICGAQGRNMHETGIVEELLLENLARNPGAVPSLWDSVLYGIMEYTPGLRLLLNCSCQSLKMGADDRIASVTGWQLTTQTFHEVEAPLFADCSGDSILAPLSGAKFRHGREGRSEYNESIEPLVGDCSTMGSSCLLQARQHSSPKQFTPPKWARKFRKESDLPPFRGMLLEDLENFWWIETGGLANTIQDAEKHRRDLLEIVFGIWDYLKNYAPERQKNANWELDWVGFLPGKRESRRYVGDYVMTQNDVESTGKFDDIIAYGGWSMDDHHPAGFYHPGQPTIYHSAPSPFGIPYRTLYSQNIQNLFCAGRNISVTHAALSATRVMATCATLGQACGTAAAIAVKEKMTPREVGHFRIKQLQQLLMDDDCFLPGLRREVPALSLSARLIASNGHNPEPLRNGFDRPVGPDEHAWECAMGDFVEYRLAKPCLLRGTRLILDSDLNRPEKNIVALRSLEQPELKLPETLLRSFDLAYQSKDGEAWLPLASIRDNSRRLIRLSCAVEAIAVRLTVLSGWGKTNTRIFSWEIEDDSDSKGGQ